MTIDGHDARDLRQEDVRRTFALAGQEAHEVIEHRPMIVGDQNARSTQREVSMMGEG